MRTQTPSEITKQMLALAAELSPSQVPIYLTVLAEPDAKVNECFPNVEAKIRQDGGEIVYGWELWEWPNVMIEGIFHAVWRLPDGELKEITPKQNGEKTILFLIDPKRIYRGTPIDNVRIALRDNLLIIHFIKISEKIIVIVNRGKPAHQHGHVNLLAADNQPYSDLEYLKNLIGEMLRQGLRAHDRCLCGSGRKYKRCHGKSPYFQT